MTKEEWLKANAGRFVVSEDELVSKESAENKEGK